jgi:hypothetical protein
VDSSSPGVFFNVGSSGSTKTAIVIFDKNPSPDKPSPNDVIFNEYWVNDNGTTYTTINDRPINGDWIELLVIKDNVDFRGWRITNNPTIDTHGSVDDGDGSILFPSNPAFSSIPSGTVILLIISSNEENDQAFPSDNLDSSDLKMIIYTGNGNLDLESDPGFSLTPDNTSLALLAPGETDSFSDDVGVDFIAENDDVTPQNFGIASHGVIFDPAFSGIGNDDGAFFQNDGGKGFINDNGDDPDRGDIFSGPGGWVVDPSKEFTGDDGSENILTPGAPNYGQDISSLIKHSLSCGWMLH